MDKFPAATRSRMMSGIRSKNTKPELVVRSKLHRMGYRFRLHVAELPGKPDVVLPRHKKAIFVHGCFWHGHGCPIGKPAKSNQGYWHQKIRNNKARDDVAKEALNQLGWSVLEIWECEVRHEQTLENTLKSFIGLCG